MVEVIKKKRGRKPKNYCNTKLESLESINENINTDEEKIMDAFTAGTYDKVVLVYNQFKNAAVQITQMEQYLPVVAVKKSNKKEQD